LVTLALALAVASLTLSQPAFAQDLDQAKAQGLIGERIDGLIGSPQSSVTPDVAALIDRINSERLAKYRSIAAKNNTSVQAVQAIVGRKLIDKASSGHYVDDGSGWRKK
jgi:uncharacterized protein YdbL (DUF1318 family)